MTARAHAAGDSAAQLYARLDARRPELERAALTRIKAISDPSEVADPEYLSGLRAAVSAAFDYALAAIEHGIERAPPLPAPLLSQARLAARNGVRLDTVLRRYIAGYGLLGRYLLAEAEEDGRLPAAELRRLLEVQSTLFDRLIAAVSEEYAREASGHPETSERRRLERVQRLLDGEFPDAAELAYEFDAHHLGMIAAGPGALDTVRALAAALDRRVLAVRREETVIWAWLGGRRRIEPERIARLAPDVRPASVSLALGEPGVGLDGWRLTHMQARSALPIVLRTHTPCVRYADVAMLASVSRDDILVASLRQLFLLPLEQERDGGAALRETLRAYLAADRNVSSTAAILGVTRQTVNNRLRSVERLIGRPLSTCATEIDVALRLERFAAQAERCANGQIA